MVDIFGKYYYIDIERILEQCRVEKAAPIVLDILEIETPQETVVEGEENEIEEEVEEIVSETPEEQPAYDMIKYELIRSFVDKLLHEPDVEDEEKKNLGLFATSSTISFNLAFNSLIKSEIIKIETEIDYENE